MDIAAGSLSALGYIIVAGIMNGAYALPLKYTKRWDWENTWLAFTVFGVCVMPVLLGIITVPHLWSIYGQVSPGLIFRIMFFGIAWGVSLVLFGLAVKMIGVAITFAVSLTTSASAGSLIPLLLAHPEKVFTSEGLMIFLGLALTLVGVGLCANAGKQREKDEATKTGLTKTGFLHGFIFALLSGVCGSMLNYAVAFGSPLIDAARSNGAHPAMVTNAVWVVALLAGAIPGIIYCVYLLKKNGTANKFAQSGTASYWFMAFLMGVLWFGSVVLYGVAVLRIGEMGAILGWPLFMTAIVIMSTAFGVITGEWNDASTRARVTMGAGIFFLVLTIVVLTVAKRAGT